MNKCTHEEFQISLKKQLKKYFGNSLFYNAIHQRADIVYKVFITDLTPVRNILLPTYNSRGQNPWDPVCMFRTYWLMCQYGDGSISKWVETLQTEPFWAILSGFNPDKVPGIGTFYDFEKRLCDFDKGQRVERTKNMHKPHSKPRKKLKKNEKQPPKHKGIVERLKNRVTREDNNPQPERPDDKLQLIFKDCFVMNSADKDLLGDTENFSVSGDGMVLATGGSPYGIKECDCWEKHGILTCDCPRRFSDPDANWGWDSYREIYVYGYSNYTFTAADSPNDLPIFSTLAQASRHDSVTHTYSLYRMKNLYSEFNITSDILDSAQDNYATYELLKEWDIKPFIALNKRNKGNFKYDPPIDVNDEGVPICKAGFKMVNWGPEPKRRRHKWRCPHVTLKGCTCPEFNCTDSDYGRTVHTKPEWDLRIFTPTPRDSKKWKKTMKKRTSSERRNSQVKEHFNLENDNVRSKSRWFIRIVMRDAAIHANAWVKNSDIKPKKWLSTWFNSNQAAA